MTQIFEQCANLLKENDKSFQKMHFLNKEMYDILNRPSSGYLNDDDDDLPSGKNEEPRIFFD